MTDADRHPDGQGDNSRIDRLLSEEFDRTFSESENPHEALRSMAPTLTRARRIHTIRQAGLGLAAGIVVVGGVALSQRTILLDNTVVAATDGVDDSTAHADDQDEPSLVVDGTTLLEPRPDPGSTDDDPDDGTTAGDDTDSSDVDVDTAEGGDQPSSGSSNTTTTTTTVESGDDSKPTTSMPDGGDDTATSLQPDGSTVVYTECGDIVVGTEGGQLDLREVRPDSGYRFEVKSDSSMFIEIGLEREHGHCEIKVRYSDGRLKIDEHDDHEDD